MGIRNWFRRGKGNAANSQTNPPAGNPAPANTGDNAGNQAQEARGSGGSTFSPTFLLENVKNPHFLVGFSLVFILLMALWYFNFLHIREVITGYGFTILGLITVVVMICFILYGWFTCKDNPAKFYIATALFIWMLDLVPEDTWLIGPLLGPEWAGYVFPIDAGTWQISLLSVLLSGIFFSMLYVNMVLNIIEKEYIVFTFMFILIIITNYFFNFLGSFFPYLNLSFSFPYGKIGYAIGILFFLVIIGVMAWKLDKNKRGALPEFFSSVYMYFVFSFFLVNNGWAGNYRAWFHAFYILAFGFGYMKLMEDNKSVRYFFIPTLLIIDFFGYGILYNTDILALQFIPPLVIFVIFYCYEKETTHGMKNYTYPVAAFVLLATFILIMSINVAGFEEGGTIPFVAKKGTGFKDLYGTFTGKLREAIEGRIEVATGGYYRGNVEKNQYESLGVYFSNIRAADPKFYTDEPITIWGSIRSKTFKDAVIVKFGCNRLYKSEKVSASRIFPDIKIPVFALEEIDTECTFLPNSEKPVKTGGNMITLSAEYNFATDAYLKSYFIDRDRFRAYSRENIDPLTELGIKDKNPIPIYTNGPVEIGINTPSLIQVSEGYTIKPAIGISLLNRQEIQDKDKRIISRWDGKIKNITELVLLVPPGIIIPDIKSCSSETDSERQKCPCNLPFKEYGSSDCRASCEEHVKKPCEDVCKDVYKDAPAKQGSCIAECSISLENCNKECNTLFQAAPDEGPAGGEYRAYSLDVNSREFKSLNKDIDKARSFQCRFDAAANILDQTPITTRYFRVRARYNYLTENSVQVNVEEPIIKTEIVPEQFIPKSFEGLELPPDITPDVILALAYVESGLVHCCQTEGRTSAATCTKSDEERCPRERTLTSGTSFGMMQILYNQPQSVNYVNNLILKHCQTGQNIFDLECNLRVGVIILKEKYDSFKNGCMETSTWKNKDSLSESTRRRVDTFLDACEKCTSDRQPYSTYSSYRGIEAALRGYNGWGCSAQYDKGFVEKVKNALNNIQNGKIANADNLKNLITTKAGDMFQETGQ